MSADETPTYYIYYRNQEGRGLSPRDHIIKDGEALCNYGVSVPETDSLKPISEVSNSEWALIFSSQSNLCDECSRNLDHYDFVPEDLPDEPPVFICPVCDESADDVDFMSHLVYVHHEDEGPSWPPSYNTHKIPREQYDLWRQNPEDVLLDQSN